MRRVTDRKKRAHSAGGTKHAGKRSRRAALLYGAVCVLVFVLAKAGESRILGFPAEALFSALKFLLPGGTAVFLALAWLLPEAEQSEFFRVFGWLYHPGLCLLAAVSFAGEAGTWTGGTAELIHMACVTGWTLLAAGMIVLILIIKEKQI